MRTRHLALLLVGTALWALLRAVLCYDEAPWQPVLYDYYHIDLGELSANQDQGAFGNSRSKIPAPMDAIVDVINDLGIKLLAIHNEHNENNIAISPYGAFSVLAALSEGLQGDSFHEILHSARIPHDKQLIRVGLRDIHRHLKSYFIPEEGFLAGLTLNLNNVSLKSEYEDVLRFYGFDYNSFNNALYPDPPTTRKTVEGTTLETGFGVSDDTTSTTTEKAEETTVSVISKGGAEVPPTSPPTTTTAVPSIPTPATTTSAPTTTTEVEIINNKEELTTTTTLPPPTTTTTTETPTTTTGTETTTTEAVTTSTAPATETSVIETLEITATSSSTTPNEELGTNTKSTGSTAARVTSVTSSSQSKTATGFTTTKMLETTAELHSTTSSDSETASTNMQIVTVTPPELTTETETSTKIKENTVRTTREIATSTVEPTTMTLKDLNTSPTSQDSTTLSLSTLPVVSFSSPIVETTTFEITTPSTNTEASIENNTFSTFSMEDVESSTSVTSSQESTTINVLEPEGTSSTSVTQTSLETIESVASTTELFADQDQETTTAFFFGTTNNVQENLESNENFVPNYNYDENVPPEYNGARVEDNLMTSPEGQNANLKRSVRSPIVDYVIARHKCRILYEEPQFVALSQRTHYVPEEGTTFAVYGKYREPAAFMKYDTVLPYMFVPNLNAIALSFPLDSTKYYLLLLLPLRDDGVDQLICDLRLYGNLRFILDNLRLTHVEAIIPSFTLKGYVTLTPTLQKLGIRKIFEPRQSDFSPMTNASDIYVTNIEQAVTVTIRNYLDPSAQRYKNLQQYPPVRFKADHPFLYFVVDSELHVALMVGKVINPLNTRIS